MISMMNLFSEEKKCHSSSWRWGWEGAEDELTLTLILFVFRVCATDWLCLAVVHTGNCVIIDFITHGILLNQAPQQWNGENCCQSNVTIYRNGLQSTKFFVIIFSIFFVFWNIQIALAVCANVHANESSILSSNIRMRRAHGWPWPFQLQSIRAGVPNENVQYDNVNIWNPAMHV